MAQIETIGGGISYTPDGKKLTRQVYVLTDGTQSVAPQVIPGSTITSADFTKLEGGVTRVTLTWTEGVVSAGGSAGASIGGASVELIGGSREVPIQSHPAFKDTVSDEQRTEIEKAIQNNQDPDVSIVPIDPTNRARILYNRLFSKREYYFAPAVTYRETTLEARLPNLLNLCTVANPPVGAPQVQSRQNWLLTSINARSVARPTGVAVYEISREWMLSDRNGWDAEQVIYTGV